VCHITIKSDDRVLRKTRERVDELESRLRLCRASNGGKKKGRGLKEGTARTCALSIRGFTIKARQRYAEEGAVARRALLSRISGLT